MSGDIRIGTINIGNVYLVSGTAPENVLGFFEALKKQMESGAISGVGGDVDYHGVPMEEAAPEDPPTPAEEAEIDQERAERYVTQEKVAALARSNLLRNVVHHVDSARKMEGFQTNHERRPRRIGAVDTKQAEEFVMAEESLERACGHCVFRKVCRLEGNLGRWIDVHPYKDKNGEARRPGSQRVAKTESRTKFQRELSRDPQIHCDPGMRK